MDDYTGKLHHRNMIQKMQKDNNINFWLYLNIDYDRETYGSESAPYDECSGRERHVLVWREGWDKANHYVLTSYRGTEAGGVIVFNYRNEQIYLANLAGKVSWYLPNWTWCQRFERLIYVNEKPNIYNFFCKVSKCFFISKKGKTLK